MQEQATTTSQQQNVVPMGVNFDPFKELSQLTKGAAPSNEQRTQEQAQAPDVQEEEKPSRAMDAHPDEMAPLVDPKPNLEGLTDEERELLGFGGEQDDADVASWDDNHKKYLKEITGYDDPSEFKKEFTKLKTEYDLASKSLAELKRNQSILDNLDARIQRALELEVTKGKGEGQKYLKSLPDITELEKDPARMSDKSLLDLHIPDHGITQEEWELLKDEEADPAEVDALKRRIKHLRLTAVDIHKKAQAQIQEERENELKAAQQRQQEYEQAVAKAIATTKSGPMKAFLTDGHIEELRTGRLWERFLDNGVPKPELLDMILKAEKYDTVLQAVKKAMYRNGRSDGLQEFMSGLPDKPRSGRNVPEEKGTKKQGSALDEWFDSISVMQKVN